MADHDEVNQGENEHNNAVPVRTLRDYLRPIRGSTPSCIVFPNVMGNFEMKPGVIQLLTKFHGLDSENPYLHVKEFDGVCATLQYNNVTDDVFVEMMCNGEFMSKSPDDAWDYFDLLAENAQVWETTNTIERAKPGPSSKGGLYHLKEEDDVNSRIAKLTRKVEAIELGKIESKAPTFFESSCGICETNSHLTKDCPTILAFQEVLHEQANVANAYRRPFSSPYSETYNSNWQNHPNFSWRNGLSINESQGSSSHAPYVPPHKKSLEDTLQVFIQGQNQINQAVMQDIQELKNLVGQIDSKLNAITTLRSGKVIEKDIPKKVLPSKENQETKDDDGPNDKENKDDEERVYKPIAPFPQALLVHKKKETNQDILNVFRSNGKVQKEELSNHEIELLETSDEEKILELEPPLVEFNSIDIEPKETFPEVTPSKLDSLQAGNSFGNSSMLQVFSLPLPHTSFIGMSLIISFI
uniref:Uncharacterized protein n=1 Tax=Fagus sylvatica TaxID=28930 RepID=A0A2N9FDK2_FAGSY